MAQPIKITLYDPETSEPLNTYSRGFVPWGIAKSALKLQKINPQEMDDKDLDAINALIIEFFDNQFSVDDLKRCTEFSETFAVFQAIIMRASSTMEGNPTSPGPAALKKAASRRKK